MIEGKNFFTIRGHHKSGTNWVGRLLNLHPHVSSSGEFHWERISSQLIKTFHESENLTRQTGLLDQIWHSMDRFIKESILHACDTSATWIGDRTPSHIEPSLIIGARVFNVVRDGRDILVSAAYHFFNNPDFFPEYSNLDGIRELLGRHQSDSSYFIDNPTELLSCDALVRDIGAHWAETIEKNQAKIAQHPDLAALEVRYEDLHHDTESMRRKMYGFLDVDPEIALPLGFNTEAGFDREMPDRFLRKGVVGDWQNYFTPQVKATFNEVAGATLLQLGYAENLSYTAGGGGHPTSNPPTNSSTDQTVAMMRRARSLLAYGGLDGVVQRPLFDHDGGLFPHFAVAAEGCRLTDSQNRTYIDWMNGWGPVLLGYRNRNVEAAIKRQLSAGPTLSLMHPVELDVAELLVELVPCAEMVAFGKNGSDAVNASLRIARAVTGRKMILQCGFHGFHEWYTCLHPNVEGMPAGLREQVCPFPYNDLTALRSLLNEHTGQVAAVIMEPVNLAMPDAGYLEGVRQLTQEHGCLLIFDEMVTAFRLGNGGAQEYFGVTPDLCCLGKGMANGMPLSAIVGKREYMQRLPACGFGMTFRGETLSLVAAKTVLETIQQEPVCKHLASVGQEIRRGMAEAATRIGVRCDLGGPDARMTIQFPDCGTISPPSIRNLFLQECLKRGVLTNGTLLPNYAHDTQAIAETISVFEHALKIVAEAIESGRLDKSRPTGGSPAGPRAFVSNGFLECARIEDNQLHVQGWMLLEDGAADAVQLVSPRGQQFLAAVTQRPDLQEAFPGDPSALQAGYEATLPAAKFHQGEQLEFTILAMRNEQIAFRCLVVQQVHQASNSLLEPVSTNDGVLYI